MAVDPDADFLPVQGTDELGEQESKMNAVVFSQRS